MIRESNRGEPEIEVKVKVRIKAETGSEVWRMVRYEENRTRLD